MRIQRLHRILFVGFLALLLSACALSPKRADSRMASDALLVLITTHGNVDVLSSNVANEYYMPVRSSQLRPWPDALGDTPTALILSACFSGSFVPPLAAANRMVLAAAAADRHSFGCNYESDNTHFIGELFGNGFDPVTTWQQNFDRTCQDIQNKEEAMRLAPPSNPQSSIPEAWAVPTVADFLKS